VALRGVIYARYSTELQREASIEDQIRTCKDLIAEHGWELSQVFSDAAISGASRFRPGYQALLDGVRRRDFDIVVAEGLDRLSRDPEDTAALIKALKFADIKLITRSEGEVDDLHAGIKGTMNALFLTDLAIKTHRGLQGRVVAGHSAGGRAFGYDIVREMDACGEPVRGGMQINPSEASTVRRIFDMFAVGHSPIAIAHALNAEKVPGPDGNAWRDTTIQGHAKRCTGILRNELYIGRRVWNRMHYLRDPATGKRVSRMNHADQRQVTEVATLRIIDQTLWEQVQAQLEDIRAKSGADKPDRPQFWAHRAAAHLLTGKVFCGSCDSAMAMSARTTWRAARPANRGCAIIAAAFAAIRWRT
jgi:DNA invertase Pin-like site-specific DNA recombinase